jgi:hypothetical protein
MGTLEATSVPFFIIGSGKRMKLVDNCLVIVMAAVEWLLCISIGSVAWAVPPASPHDRHAFFDNAAAENEYFHSRASAVAPSELKFFNGRVPVDLDVFTSPPNSLRVSWKSATGGDWRVTIKAPQRTVRSAQFIGDTLVLKCYAPEGLKQIESPLIFLQDITNKGVPSISLLKTSGDLPPNKWVEIRLPFSEFRGRYGSTGESRFDPSELGSITVVQGLDDASPHTLYLDDIRVIDGAAEVEGVPPPSELKVEGRNNHFDLSWKPSPSKGVFTYRVYRSVDGKTFRPVATRPGWSCHHVEFAEKPGVEAYFKVSAVSLSGDESPLTDAVQGTTVELADEQLLDVVQKQCFRYYWDTANNNSGMALEILPGDENLVAVGASGFGIMAQIAATERKFITREASAARMLQIVRFLRSADRYHGAWPHFIDGNTGRTLPYFGKYDNGGDLVETAFLMQGLLTARQYFTANNATEREVRDTITDLWRGVEWDWYRKTPSSDFLYWHWSPDHAWHISHPLVGWNETMIVYLLAIASPTHAVPASMYYSGWAGQSEEAVVYRRTWSRTTTGDHYTNGETYYGIKLLVGSGTGGDLFFTQFSFLGFDPRDKRDRFANYFDNNRSLALINRAYCVANPRGFDGYGQNCWGLSAGINTGGGHPIPRDDNGTICCSAALGVFPYTPVESNAVLKHFYSDLGPKIWGAYGFHDGFNATEGWFDEVYLGLNQAQIVAGIENHRTGLLWKLFMANPEMQRMQEAIGFKPDSKPTVVTDISRTDVINAGSANAQ